MMKRFTSILLVSLGAVACEDPFVADAVREYVAVTTGGEHTCAVSTGGAAYCWGRGLDGELGTGNKQNQPTPALVTGGLSFSQITAGDNHTCALTTSGEAYCWGWNAFFERGNDVDGRDAEPVKPITERRFTSISAGAHHTCALATDSIAYCWGNNRYGQVGDGTINTGIRPRVVQSLVKFKQISSGAYHACAVDAAGVLYCWGRNEYGQLGIGANALSSLLPVAVNTNLRFSSVDAGATHTCAIAVDRRFFCWGSSEYGELGDGAVFKPGLPGALVPAPVSSQFPIGVAISAGQSHTCAIDPNGAAACWGRGEFGQLANGSLADNYHPQPVHLQPTGQHKSDFFTMTAVAAGGATHACGLADLSVYCWGTGRFGQLGVANMTFAPLPLRVAD
jgi:alpha-tubulin suppressor-like RCC1 family protein